jgi:uncharacterized protein involved in exopolysaccharide biosynthesis
MTYHDILNIILTHRKKILKVTIISSALLFFILFLIYPKTYTAPATILPPENKEQFGSLSDLLSGQDFSSLLTGGLSNANSQLFVEILKSRSAAEYVVRKHNLIDYFGMDSEYETTQELTERLNLDVNKEGIITISVNVNTSLLPLFFDDEDSVKKFSAALTNSFTEALDKINREKLSTKAKRARIYIEGELKKTRIQLDSVEVALMNFQERNKTVALPEQVTAAIDAAAMIKSEIMKTEVEIGLMGTNLREDSKELQTLRKKREQLQEQYNKMELGNQDYLLAFREVPELGKELATLLREVKIQNEVYILLQQQYYKERIQENRDLPTVEVLDKAITPFRKSAPKTVVSTITGGIFIFLAVSLLVVFEEKKKNQYLNKNKDKKIV